jgi:hypothetical protein
VKLSTSDDVKSQAKWVAFSALYLAGLLGLIMNAPAYIEKLIQILLRYLWGPVAFMLVSPIIGFLYIFVPIAGTITFATWGMRFLRGRLAASCIVVATLYLAGNYLDFHRNQWFLLHAYMCAGLLARESHGEIEKGCHFRHK